MPLHLFVPDLLPPTDASAAMRAVRLPGLEKWLARGARESSAGGGTPRAMAALFGVAEPVPYAALSAAGEEPALAPAAGGEDGSTWLRADPVHLRIDHDYVRLHDASILDVAAEEAAELVAGLQAHFARDGLAFQVAMPDRWYVRVPAGAMPKTTPLAEAVGRDVFGLLPQAGGPINWRAAITEAQMVMGAHEVNARREQAGKPAVNSVWFWGEGAAPATIPRRYGRVLAHDPLARGLAAASGADLGTPPASFAEMDVGTDDLPRLVVLDALTAPMRRADGAAWSEAARQLDAGWFAFLGDAIKRFGEVRVVLPGERATLVATLDPAARWRWFRGSRPIAADA